MTVVLCPSMKYSFESIDADVCLFFFLFLFFLQLKHPHYFTGGQSQEESEGWLEELFVKSSFPKKEVMNLSQVRR